MYIPQKNTISDLDTPEFLVFLKQYIDKTNSESYTLLHECYNRISRLHETQTLNSSFDENSK